MDPALGLRVVRGPDWEWGDQDGGEGFVGTVAVLGESAGEVIVQWDMGQRCNYRCGKDSKFDIRVLDNAQIGIKHQSVQCASCGGDICGFRWVCIHCSEFGSLCSRCYMSGQHSTQHSFIRIDADGGDRVKVPPRHTCERGMLSGVFPGAVVVRGYDWTWKEQDGGSGNPGDVKNITDWKGTVYNSIVEVLWRAVRTTNAKNYRLGYKGKVDVKCVTPSSGGQYYPTHLPVLGGERPMPATDLIAGDQVRVTADQDTWKNLQEGYGQWDEFMAEFIGTVGVIQHITDCGGLIIGYPGKATFHVNPEAVTKVDDSYEYKVGDAVDVIEDKAKVSALQKGHGDWIDDMTESLGRSGKVVKVLTSGDVQVAVAGKRWVFNPFCLQPAQGEQSKESSDESQVSDVVRDQLELLMQQSSPELVVAASAAGDLTTLTTFLKEHPEAVNTKVEGKTGLLVATAEGWPKVVTALIEFKAAVDEPDEEGDTCLHYCAHLDRYDIAKELLAHNANPNACNQLGAFPLMYAVALGNYNVLEVLATGNNLDHSVQDSEGNTALHVAVASHRAKAVRILMEAGATPTVANHIHLTPILTAANTGFYLGLEYFLKRYPEDVSSSRDSDGNTALHTATANNHLDIVCLLTDSGYCDVNATNAKNQTALHIAAHGGYTRVIEHLVVHCNADCNAVNAENNTPLKLVIANKTIVKNPSDDSPQTLEISNELIGSTSGAPPANYVAVACLLVRRGATFNKEKLQAIGCPPQTADLIASYAQGSTSGDTDAGSDPSTLQKAFFDAVKRGQVDKVQQCHEAGAKLTCGDANGWTALHHAARLGKYDVMEYLVAHSPQEALDLLEDEKLQTPLHKAAWYGYVDICKLLVENGASLLKQDYQGNTVLSQATQYGDKELLRYLQSKLSGNH